MSLKVFCAFGTRKLVKGCHPNNSTSTAARGLSNLRATAHSAPLHGASATARPFSPPAYTGTGRRSRSHLASASKPALPSTDPRSHRGFTKLQPLTKYFVRKRRGPCTLCPSARPHSGIRNRRLAVENLVRRLGYFKTCLEHAVRMRYPISATSNFLDRRRP